jgi:hypothetical protein
LSEITKEDKQKLAKIMTNLIIAKVYSSVTVWRNNPATLSSFPALESVCGCVHGFLVQRLSGLHLMAWLDRPPS